MAGPLVVVMDEFRIDGHKLMLHPRRVADWLAGRNIAPLYLEISPSGACNHRCRFCGLDFMGYRPRFLPADIMKGRFKEMSAAGLKSVMFAGEGEPFLHRDMGRLARDAKEAGLDVAFTTNAVLLKPETAREVLPVTTWIKVSCNAGTARTYALVHGTREGDFGKMLANMEKAAALRGDLGSACTLGFQMVLLPENQAEAVTLARTLRGLGADYLVIKPYSVHPRSAKDNYSGLTYDDCRPLAEALSELDATSFKVIFRHEAMRRTREPASYQECLALPFGGYIDSSGLIWACCRQIGENGFYYGNILESPFADILSSRKLPSCFRIDECHTDCRMDPINAYLWNLTHPGELHNFI